MKCYVVGGAVRDRLLKRQVVDHDWVVVGETFDSMLAAGFQPVGRDFPVFLHPKTHEEYALARTERNAGRGYRGFTVYAEPDVTLEQDLARRDLTINAMAEDENGNIIDPFNGQADLAAGVLRHVSPAFVEDPVRVLRLARFAARYGFSVAPETMKLMRWMVDDGEVDHLVPERIWQELAKGLMEDRPSLMFMVLRECGALARVLPEVDALFGVPQRADYHPEIDTGDHTMRVVNYAAGRKAPLAVRFAALTHDLGKALTPPDVLPRHITHEQRGKQPINTLCERVRVPVECRDLALMTAQYHTLVHTAAELRPETVHRLFRDSDALRRPERFHMMLEACLADARGRLHFEDCAYPQAEYLKTLLDAARSVDAGAIAKRCTDPREIPRAVEAARVAAIAEAKLRNPIPSRP